jgi:hypothetical protein
MPTTDVIMSLNMGFQDGPNERIMDKTELRSNYTGLKCHMCNMLPMPADLGLEDQVETIAFNSLEIGGQWTSGAPPITYAMQLVVSITHERPLSFTSVAAIIEAIHANGLSSPMTIEEDANYFLHPHQSIVSDLDDGICCGH